MEEFHLQFNIKPVVKERPRMTRSGHVYTPKKTSDYEKSIKSEAIRQISGDPIQGPVVVEIEFILKRPKNPSHLYPRGDVDNYCKALLDALNDVVWVDDSQIVGLAAHKRYGVEDRIHIVIIPLDPKNLIDGDDLTVRN